VSDYKWKPIEPLSDRDRQIDLAAMRPLYETWRASKERLRQSSPASLKEFSRRLVRRLSIETGILERLYDLDRGTTEALVAHGFVEDLVSHSSTDIEPSRLIDILRDQEAVCLQLVAGAPYPDHDPSTRPSLLRLAPSRGRSLETHLRHKP